MDALWGETMVKSLNRNEEFRNTRVSASISALQWELNIKIQARRPLVSTRYPGQVNPEAQTRHGKCLKGETIDLIYRT